MLLSLVNMGGVWMQHVFVPCKNRYVRCQDMCLLKMSCSIYSTSKVISVMTYGPPERV